jgi:signal peptidase II
LKIIRIYWFLFVVAGLIVTLDQWTKSIVRRNLALGETWLPQGWEDLHPYARILHTYNTGAAFGMFQDGWKVFAVLAFVVIGLIIFFYATVASDDWWLRLAMGMQMGGAAGNLVDRLTQQGRVTDYVSVGSFPVFNVADASITVGVAVLLLGVWLKERSEKQAAAASEPQDGDESPAEETGEPQGG